MGHDHDAQSFVIRIRLDSAVASAACALPRIRIEHVNRCSVWHFTDVDAALARLKSSFDAIVTGSPA